MVAPIIAGFVTRAQWNARPPRSVTRNITPTGGVTVHYGGPAQKLSDHAACTRRVKQWQDYHMGEHKWADIAYTGLFCDHGYAYAGRGAGVRTAANGTNAGNQRWYAVTWLGGEGERPTAQAVAAGAWWVRELRAAGAGRGINVHRDHKSTACAGDPLRDLVRAGAFEPTGEPPPPPPPISAPKGSGDMLLYWYDGAVYIVTGGKRSHYGLHGETVDALAKSGVPLLPGTPNENQKLQSVNGPLFHALPTFG
jgi:hypothetical protein